VLQSDQHEIQRHAQRADRHHSHDHRRCVERGVALGAFNLERLKDDYELMRAAFDIPMPVEVEETAINDFLLKA
jgi:hypothetical protein